MNLFLSNVPFTVTIYRARLVIIKSEIAGELQEIEFSLNYSSHGTYFHFGKSLQEQNLELA